MTADLADRLADAIAARVEQTLNATPDPTFVPVAAARRRRPGRALLAVLTLAGAAAAGGRGYQLAQRDPSPTTVDVGVADESASGKPPRLMLDDPRFNLSGYETLGPQDPMRLLTVVLDATGEGAHVLMSEDTHVKFENASDVQIGGHVGQLVAGGRDWGVAWTIGSNRFAASGSGERPSPALIDALGLVVANGKAIELRTPAVGVTAEHPNSNGSYWVSYTGGAMTPGRILGLNVSPKSLNIRQNGGTMRTVQRGGRRYEVFESDTGVSSIQLTFEVDGWNVSLFADTRDRVAVLDLADRIRPATDTEWRAVQASHHDFGSSLTPGLLLDGTVEGGAAFELSAPPEERDVCTTIRLASGGLRSDACLDGTSQGLRLVRVARVGDRQLVYGIDAAPAGAASDDDKYHVVRVLDASGSGVGEDVTVDQTEIDARAFTIELPAGAKGPFVVELYDFDRAWYDAYDSARNNAPDSFVKPGAPVIDRQSAIEATLQ